MKSANCASSMRADPRRRPSTIALGPWRAPPPLDLVGSEPGGERGGLQRQHLLGRERMPAFATLTQSSPPPRDRAAVEPRLDHRGERGCRRARTPCPSRRPTGRLACRGTRCRRRVDDARGQPLDDLVEHAPERHAGDAEVQRAELARRALPPASGIRARASAAAEQPEGEVHDAIVVVAREAEERRAPSRRAAPRSRCSGCRSCAARGRPCPARRRDPRSGSGGSRRRCDRHGHERPAGSRAASRRDSAARSRARPTPRGRR